MNCKTVIQILTGDIEYRPNHRESISLPGSMQESWETYCDFKESDFIRKPLRELFEHELAIYKRAKKCSFALLYWCYMQEKNNDDI